jgi:hypothetical protein
VGWGAVSRPGPPILLGKCPNVCGLGLDFRSDLMVGQCSKDPIRMALDETNGAVSPGGEDVTAPAE